MSPSAAAALPADIAEAQGSPSPGCADVSEALARCAARIYLYTTFGQVMGSEPTDALRSALTSPLAAQAWSILDAPDKAGQSLGRIAEELDDADYTRLFIGPGPLPSAPWESMHLSCRQSLFTANTLAVRNFYRRCGFKAQGSPQLPDDHLATELLFLAALTREEARALNSEGGQDRAEAIREDQRRFLDEHLLRWAPLFAKALVDAEPASCYAMAAQKLLHLLKADRAALG